MGTTTDQANPMEDMEVHVATGDLRQGYGRYQGREWFGCLRCLVAGDFGQSRVMMVMMVIAFSVATFKYMEFFGVPKKIASCVSRMV